LSNYLEALNFGIGLLLKDMSYLAIEHFNGLLQRNPKLVDAWIYLSTAYFNIQNFEKSYSASEMVLTLDAENMKIHGIRGSLFLEWGQYDAAIESFEKYLLEFPDNDSILLEKAYCHYNIGQFNETIRCYNEILRLFPQHHEALELRRYVLEEQQQSNEALPAA
jgi:tetratricopeptide (TPR) repeat protein